MAEDLVPNLQATINELGIHIVNQGNLLNSVSTQLTYHGVNGFVEVYDGNQAKFGEWIHSLEKFSVLNSLSSEAKIKVALQTTKGVVSDFIFRWQENTGVEDRNWDNLKRELTSRFSLVTDARHAKNMLRRIKQKPEEPITVYSGRILNLAIDAYGSPTVNEPLVQAELIECFIDGLNNMKLKYKLMERNPQTFENAVQIANADQNLRKMFTMRTSKNIENARETPMEVDHSRNKRCSHCQRFGHLMSECRLKQRQTTARTFQQNVVEAAKLNGNNHPRFNDEPASSNKYVCYHCNEPGHLKRNCYSLQMKNEGSRVCYYCNKPGHLKRNCYLFQRENEERGRREGQTKYNAYMKNENLDYMPRTDRRQEN